MSTALRTYFRGHTLATMRDEVSGVNRNYYFDHQGTTQCLTDDTGAVTDRFACDAWGVQVKRTGSSINRHWYIGNLGYQRDALARDYVRARHLCLSMARWVGPDVVQYRPSRYAYTYNRPARLSDATGWFANAPECKPVTTNCCDSRTLAAFRAVYGHLCPGDVWDHCGQFDPKNAELLRADCLGRADCSELSRRFASVSKACSFACSGTPPQEDGGFVAWAYTDCCRDITREGQLTTYGRCRSCGTYCCDAHIPPDPCVRYCLYAHERKHQLQCDQDNFCNIEGDRKRTAMFECGGYLAEAVCLFELISTLGGPVDGEAGRDFRLCLLGFIGRP